jgi:hypothetical protein
VTSPTVCVAENLVVGADGKLRLAPWSRPRNVVDVMCPSAADTTKLLETKTLPGRLLVDKPVLWRNDTPVDHDVRVIVTRRWRRWVTSNPNAVQFRDRWSSAITPKDAEEPILPAEPFTTDYLNGQTGGASDIGTNSVAEPNPGKFWHWIGTNTTDERLGPIKPGETLRVWYRQYVWTPPPWSNNANKNSPAHEAEAGWVRLQLMAFPQQGRLVTG